MQVGEKNQLSKLSCLRNKLSQALIISLCFCVAPSSPPENLTVSVISSTSIGLTWTPPLLLARNGIITEYHINVTELDTGSSQILTSFTTSLVAQMLHPYYTYDFSVSAHTVATGPYSDSEIIQTPEDGEWEDDLSRSTHQSYSLRVTLTLPLNCVILKYAIVNMGIVRLSCEPCDCILYAVYCTSTRNHATILNHPGL